MQKILTIIFLGLLFSGNANALTLNKCFKSTHSQNRDVQSEFLSDKYENYYYKITKNNILKAYVYSDSGLQKQQAIMDESWVNAGLPLSKSPRVDKISKGNHNITYVDENYVKSEKISDIPFNQGNGRGIEQKIIITINLKTGLVTTTVDKRVYPDQSIFSRDYEYTYQCEKPSGSSSSEDVASSGSGFFINNKGYFITNNHVVKGCKQSKITFKEESVDAEVVATDQTLDLALMKAKVKPKNYLNLSDEPPEKLQKIYVAGYPFGKGLSDDLKLTQGIISSVKGYKDNSNQIQIDAAINSGNSGGPIVNEDGDLVGVAVSGLNKSKSEGIAFGIKSAAVKNFLDVNKIKYSTSSLMNFGMSNKKLNNLLEDSAVYTFCN